MKGEYPGFSVNDIIRCTVFDIRMYLKKLELYALNNIDISKSPYVTTIEKYRFNQFFE